MEDRALGEGQPRVKFAARRAGSCELPAGTPGLEALSRLMGRMEALGAAPVLPDGKVGGNCGILVDLPGSDGPCLFVSRTGKPAGLHLAPSDFVQVVSFDATSWSAEYRTAPGRPDHTPTSDTPLLHACLSLEDGKERHHWAEHPRVALHGHALAAGDGLEAARRLGLPISEHETLFSTPADLQELEALLAGHPYPQQSVFIRRGHGFFLLGSSVADVEATFERLVVPFLMQQQQQEQVQE